MSGTAISWAHFLEGADRMTHYMHENTVKRHRCPACHCVMPYWYRPIRKWLYDTRLKVVLFLEFRLPRSLRWTRRLLPEVDSLLPRRCRECVDVVVVPEWMAPFFRLSEDGPRWTDRAHQLLVDLRYQVRSLYCRGRLHYRARVTHTKPSQNRRRM
jgi:hypothetical protein